MRTPRGFTPTKSVYLALLDYQEAANAVAVAQTTLKFGRWTAEVTNSLTPGSEGKWDVCLYANGILNNAEVDMVRHQVSGILNGIRHLMLKKSADSSKQDEIDALRKIANSIPSNWYLASLFSDQLIDWVASKIGDDMPPDVIEWLDYVRQLAQQQVAAEVDLLKTEKGAVELQLLRSQAIYNELLDRNGKLVMQRDNLETELESSRRNHATLLEDFERLNAKYQAARPDAEHWRSLTSAMAEVVRTQEIRGG